MTGDQSLFTKLQLIHRPPSPYPQHLIFPVKPFMVEKKKTSNFTVFISSVLSDPSRIIYHRFMSCPQTTSAELLLLRRAQYLHPKHICRSKHWMMEFTCAQPKSEPKSFRHIHCFCWLLLYEATFCYAFWKAISSIFRAFVVGRKFQTGLWSAYRLNSYLSGLETK